MTWKAVFNNPADKHSAYRAAVAADAAWSRELQRVYGKRAGDARYDKRGVATPELRRLHDAWVLKEQRRENPVTSCMGCTRTAESRTSSVLTAKQKLSQQRRNCCAVRSSRAT